MTLDPNDPKLTAYVLGELDEADRAAVEAELAESPELRRTVEAIRRTSELVADSLQAEAAPSLTPEQVERIEEASREMTAPAGDADRRRSYSRRTATLVALAASLLIAVGLGLFALPRLLNERVSFVEPSAPHERLPELRQRGKDARDEAGKEELTGEEATVEIGGQTLRSPYFTSDDVQYAPSESFGPLVSPSSPGEPAQQRWDASETMPGMPGMSPSRSVMGPEKSAVGDRPHADSGMAGMMGSQGSSTAPRVNLNQYRGESMGYGGSKAEEEYDYGNAKSQQGLEGVGPGGMLGARRRQSGMGGMGMGGYGGREYGGYGEEMGSGQYGGEESSVDSRGRPTTGTLPAGTDPRRSDMDPQIAAYPSDPSGQNRPVEEPTSGEERFGERGPRPANESASSPAPAGLEGRDEAGERGAPTLGGSVASSRDGKSNRSELSGLERTTVEALGFHDRREMDRSSPETSPAGGEPGSPQPDPGKAEDELRGRNQLFGRHVENPSEERDEEERLVKQRAAGADAEVAGETTTETRKKPARPATWRRARATPNASRLMIGDHDELPLEGMQANVQVDGFRARVLLDYYFYNDRDRQYEGTFKLRLPNEASLYFFAFGQCTFQYQPQEQDKPIRAAFLMASHSTGTGNMPEEILKLRANTWAAPKVARVVPKEKAAFAYRETVRRRVDPALVEWSGAGVFASRVFPLVPKKLHRIVVGYDIDLTRVGGDLEYRLDLPEVNDCAVDLNLAAWAGGSAVVTPEVKPFMSGGRALYHFDNPSQRGIVMRLGDPGTVLLTGSDEKTGDYFAVSFQPEFEEAAKRPNSVPDAQAEEDAEASASTAVFLLDTSLSANPDKFNAWLKILRAMLESNHNSIRQFAVLTFNIEAHWWQEKFVENTPKNVEALLDFAHTLSLEGATDLGQAIREAASPSWFRAEDEVEPWDVFLLSDGALTWGETNLHLLAAKLTGPSSHAGSLFAYRTGMAGTAGEVLEMLARQTGGAVFSVVGEAEIAKAARAHRSRPWQLESVEADGGRDLLLAGRPTTIFTGQQLLLVGRGRPEQDKPVLLNLRRGKKMKTIRVKPERVMDTELAPRLYGQVAVGQLELLADATEDMSVSYARHFRVTGRTCSLLMLESEADYQRFDIKPEDDEFVVKTSLVSRVVDAAITKTEKLLADPKATFQAWLERMEKMPGMTFRVSPALKLAIESLPSNAFEVETNPRGTKHRTWDGVASELKEDLSQGKVDYDAVHIESQRRLTEYGPSDALRVCSSLVENSPGDLVLALDVAYSALQWELADQAYHLLRRVAAARPYEPQSYLTMAQALAQTGHNDLALLYYEVASGGTWDSRFHEFHRIVSFHYLQFLQEIATGRREAALKEYASARLERVRNEVKLDQADLVITMMWNTDGTDVDLHVFEPTGEECHYQNRRTRIGGQLTPDCTQGFGPEMYVLPSAKDGKYGIKVKYYASDANRAGMRTKVYATVHQGWGTGKPRTVRKALTLNSDKEMLHIATIGFSN